MTLIDWIRKQAVRHPVDPLQIIGIAIEFVLACTTLGVLLSVYPKNFRETLWLIGGEAGWNSNPRLRIYFYANYKEPPEIAFIWTHSLDAANLATSILSFSISLTRIFFTYFHMTARVYNTFYDMLLSVLWAYSLSRQLSGDYSDPKHLSHRPWYLERGCSQVEPVYAKFCHLSKAAFAFSVLSAIFYCSRVVFSVLRIAYGCGKLEIFEGGAEHAYRQLWHDQNNEDDEAKKMSFIDNRRENEYMLI